MLEERSLEQDDIFYRQFEGADEIETQETEHRFSLRQKLSNLRHDIANIWHEARYDFHDGDQKKRKLLSCIGFIACQAVGQTKLPSAALPIVAVEVLEKTGSPTVSGLAAAAFYGASTYVGLEAMNDSITQFPNAFNEVGRSFPNAIARTTESLPGYEVDEAAKEESTPKKIGRFAVTHAARGVMAYFAASAYVAAAGIDGKPKEMRRKLSAKVAADGAAIVGLSTLAIGEVLASLGKNNPVLAEHVQGYMKNPAVVYGALGGIVLLQWMKNSGVQRLKNWWENRKNENRTSEHRQLAYEKQ